jgi:hypothetical protein
MPVRVFRQEGAGLVDRTVEAGLAETHGWWNSVTVADLRGSGRQDLILGNLGLNSYVKGSRREPVRLYAQDFFSDGTWESFLTLYKNGTSYPMAGRDEILRAMPALAGRFPTYHDFGAARIEDILPGAELRRAEVREAYLFASAVALNRGDGTFALQPLPTEAQFAPIHDALPGDFDGDGRTDVLLGGNHFGVPPTRGRYDASLGLLLRGDGAGTLIPVDAEAANLAIGGQVRKFAALRRAGGDLVILVARNGEPLQILRPVRWPGARADR